MKKLLYTLLFSLIAFCGYGQGFYQGEGFYVNLSNSSYVFESSSYFLYVRTCPQYVDELPILSITVDDTDEYIITDEVGNELKRFYGNTIIDSVDYLLYIKKVRDNSLLFMVKNEKIPSQLINSISFSSQKLINDTISICEKLDDYQIDYHLNGLNGFSCSDANTLPYYGRWFINNEKQEITNQIIFNKNKLKDGDKLKFVLYENQRAQSSDTYPNCDCLELIKGSINNYSKDDTISSNEIVVKIIKNDTIPKPTFINGIDGICPGDTAVLESSKFAGNIRWGLNSTNSSSIKKIVSTGFNNFYINSTETKDNGCYAVSDAVIVKRKDCNTGKMIRGYIFDYFNFAIEDKLEFNRVFANVKVQLRGTDQFAFTDENGVFTIQPVMIKYNTLNYIDIVDDDFAKNSSSIGFWGEDTLYAESYLTTNKLASSDLALRIESGRSRPGFTIPFYFSITNQGKLTNGGTLTVTLDNAFTYSSASTTPTNINGKTLTFTVDSLASSLTQTITVYATLATTSALGSTVNTKASLTTTKTDVNLTNNTFALASTVSGSFDPNDIAVTPKGIGSKGAIRDTTKLDYTIRFQNMGTDTAFTVVVKSKLPNGVDFSKFQMLNASHNYALSVQNDTVVWTFNNILLPDNKVNEPKSHGLIRYKIHQKAGNLTGTEIKNKAAIYFDFNAPVLTNEVLNTVDNTITGIESETNLAENGAILFPNPSEGQLFIQAKENGTLKMFNCLGGLVFTSKYEQETKTDISFLPKGVYFYQLEGTQHKASGKVILK